MKRTILLILAILVSTLSFAQVTAPKLFLVNFIDKGSTKSMIQDPSRYLSSKAIERRSKHNIPIDYTDLPVNDQYVIQIVSKGAKVICRSRWFNYIVIETNQADLMEIAALPFISKIRVLDNSITEVSGIQSSKCSIEAREQNSVIAAGLRSGNSNVYNYGSALTQISMIKGEFLHNHGYTGQGMTIAVIDAGFRDANTLPVFDSLRLNNQIKGTHNFADPVTSVYDASMSMHGTEVLSTMGANLSGVMVGTAPKADYWLLRSEVDATETLIEEYYWVSAAEFADSVGADVINSSLGYTVFKDEPQANHTYADMDGNTTYITIGADKAAEKGILVVNSAGNSGNDDWKYIGAPADGDSVFTIGAVESDGSYASFSSKGPTYDGRIKPTVVAMGVGAAVYTPFGLSYGSGTSFSSPIIAGMSACLWQAAPLLSNMQIIDAIKSTASQYNNPDTLLGWGIPDYSAAFGVLGTSNINLTSSGMKLKLYPNPFSRIIVLESEDKLQGAIKLEVLDLRGKSLYAYEMYSEQPIYQIKLNDLGSLPAGSYIIRVQTVSSLLSSVIIKI